MAGRKSRAALAAESVSIPLTETPEFRRAVEQATAQAVAAAMAQLAEHGAPKGAGTDPDATGLLRGLAMSIAEITDQGIGQQKRVDPRVIEQRETAKGRMDNLLREVHERLAQAKQSGDAAMQAEWTPEYRVIGKIYLNERLIEPFRKQADNQIVPNEIYWTGPPNDLMRPINGIAQRIYEQYRGWVGNPERVKGADTRPVWITAKGLVVKGDPPARATVAPDVEFKDALSVKDGVKMGDDPNATTINVLGTVAAPARVNQANHEARPSGV